MNPILKCLDNDPEQRIQAGTIVNTLKKMVAQFPAFLQNQLEMQKYIQISEEDKRALREVVQEKVKIIKQTEEKNSNLNTHLQNTLESEINERERMKLAHSVEVEELQLHTKHLEANLKAEKSETEAIHTEITILEKKLAEQLERLDESNQKAKAEFQASLTREMKRAESLKSEVCQLMSVNSILQATAAQATTENGALKFTVSRLEEQIATEKVKTDRYREESKIKEELLQKKDDTIATVREHLKRTREYLATKKQVSIEWESCADLPYATAAGQSTVINGKVYFGGGITDDDDKRYLVHCYSPTENEWTTLPPLPVKWFGLGQINGKLVAVGGAKKDGKKDTKVYMLDSHKWKSAIIPPMSLARTFPAVSSHRKLLIVAGGNMEGGQNTNTVEIFQQGMTQWHQAGILPKECCNLSLTNFGDTLYALGGYDKPSLLNQVLYTSTEDLSQAAGDSTKLTWKTLQSTPTLQPATAALSGSLLAVGGWRTRRASEGKVAQTSIHMYSTTADSWVYFSDLPKPCAWTTFAVLSATEFLVIGGRNEQNVRAAYKATLTVKA